MSIIPEQVPSADDLECAATATYLIEVRSEEWTLQGVTFTCAGHADETLSAIHATGARAVLRPSPVGLMIRCGWTVAYVGEVAA